MIGLLTDSSSQIPEALRRRYDVEVVPITVVVDGVAYREGVDLDADGFYAMVGDPPPSVTTAHPSPGDFAAAYRRLVERGATEVVAVLVGGDYSGALNAAQLATDLVEVPVHLVDSRTASFGITACLWEVAERLRSGDSVADALAMADKLIPEIRTSVLLDGLDWARASGRGALPPLPADRSFVFTGAGTDVTVVGAGDGIDELCDLLAAPFRARTEPIRTAVCLADPSTSVFADRLDAELRTLDHVVDIVHYRVGPSIAGHTGPGTAGGYLWPATV